MSVGQIPVSKLIMDAKNEWEFIRNLKQLQEAFIRLGIDKVVDIGRLSKAKYQDNLEFTQWMKRYWDLHYKGDWKPPAEITVKLPDGRSFEAKLMGTDPATDIALIKVKSDKPLPTVEFGDDRQLRVGDWVVAVGNPFGLSNSVTAGIVSSIGNNTQEVLASLYDAKPGITHSEDYARLGFRSQVFGRPTLNPADVVDRRAMRFLGEGAAWNHVAMEQAILDSGLEQSDISNVRTGIIMGSGGPSTRTLLEACDIARTKGPKRVGPFAVPKAMSSTVCSATASNFCRFWTLDTMCDVVSVSI